MAAARGPGAAAPVTIAPPGQLHAALAPLPVAALRISAEMAADLGRLGLRRIGDLAGQPRAALGRRFGPALMQRLDQALGAVPEPVSAVAPPPPTAVRLSLPEPIGLLDDMREGAARLLARLCARLAERGEGARAIRLEARGADGGVQAVTLRLARPMRDADAMLALLMPKLEGIDAGFGIDMLRLDAPETERTVPEQVQAPGPGAAAARGDALADLLTRLGARVGLEAITRRHPAESHIPGKTSLTLAAAWSAPAPAPWPRPVHPRPLLMWRPELVTPEADGRPCAAFRWRGRRHETAHAIGPERIAPEWWLDDPAMAQRAARLLADPDPPGRAAVALSGAWRIALGRLVLSRPLCLRPPRRRVQEWLCRAVRPGYAARSRGRRRDAHEDVRHARDRRRPRHGLGGAAQPRGAQGLRARRAGGDRHARGRVRGRGHAEGRPGEGHLQGVGHAHRDGRAREPRAIRSGKGGAAGYAKGSAAVRLEEMEGGTRLHYDVEASVGGKLAQLGSRVVDGFAKKMADQFFARLQTAVVPPEKADEVETVAPAGPDESGDAPKVGWFRRLVGRGDG